MIVLLGPEKEPETKGLAKLMKLYQQMENQVNEIKTIYIYHDGQAKVQVHLMVPKKA